MKFKAAAFLPVNNIDVKGFRIFIDKMNVKFKDYLEIELLGGPEVTPPFQLHEAVKSGVLDMCQTSCAYYPSLLWEAQAGMFKNYEISGTENYPEFYEIMSKLHEDVGLVWLDDCDLGETFHMYSNVSLDTPWNLAGLKIRVFPAFIPLVEALGAVPINLPMGDIYTAMERGAVDGFVMTHYGFVTDWSWQEVTKYVIDYPLYTTAAYVLVNPDTWNKLPPNVQQEIREFKINKIDPVALEYYTQVSDETWKQMLTPSFRPPLNKTPPKLIKFSEADGKAFLDLANDAAWDYVIAKSPEIGPKLKELLIK